MRFELDDAQTKKLYEWLKEQESKAESIQGREPYYGATGGQLTYMFTPTNLGVVVKVKHEYTKAVIDLSEYENW
jgi:predicted Zn-dependent peptidase